MERTELSLCGLQIQPAPHSLVTTLTELYYSRMRLQTWTRCVVCRKSNNGGLLWTRQRTRGVHNCRKYLLTSWATVSFSRRIPFRGATDCLLVTDDIVSCSPQYDSKVRSVCTGCALCASDVTTGWSGDRISYCSVELLLCCVMLYQVSLFKLNTHSLDITLWLLTAWAASDNTAMLM
jgi:hypothetical protein